MQVTHDESPIHIVPAVTWGGAKLFPGVLDFLHRLEMKLVIPPEQTAFPGLWLFIPEVTSPSEMGISQ